MGFNSEDQRIRETVGSCVPHDRAATMVGRSLRDRRDDTVGGGLRTPRVRLGDVFELQMGKTPARANKAYWGGSNNWVSIADIGRSGIVIGETKEKITDKAVTETGIKPIPNDTVIMSFKLTIGKVAITDGEMYSNEAIMAFIPRGVEEFDNHYLYHCFSSKNWTNASNRAVMGQTLNKALLSDATIPLPPLPAQREIAAELDRICAMKKNAEERVEICQQLVKSKFVEMFELDGTTRTPPLRCGVSSHHDVGFETSKLEDATQRVKVAFVGSCDKFYTDVGHGVPMVRTTNLTAHGYSAAGLKYVTREFHERNKKSQLHKGDVLVARHGENGRACLYEGGEANCLNVIIVVPDPEIAIPVYIEHVLNSSIVRDQIQHDLVGSTQHVLNTSGLSKVLIPIPPLPLQREFAAYVAKVEKMEAVAREMVTTAEMLYRAKLQEYFG